MIKRSRFISRWIWGIATLSTLTYCTAVHAQRQEVTSPKIASLQVLAGSDWQSLPIAQLGGNAIHIDFDEMSHNYRRFSYKIEHCEADWTTSTDIYDTSYMTGLSDNLLIENVEQSLNTTALYTHYQLTIPNENCRLTMSGNYRLTVYDENTGEKMLVACFMLVEPLAEVSLGYGGNTDIDINKSHHQVRMSLNYNNIKVTNPSSQIKTIVLQNGRWDAAVTHIKPDYISAAGLQWQHNRQLIFDAGNVYRKFEMLDLDHPTMGVDEITWDGESYHVKVQEDLPRPSYVYDESAQGGFCIRNSNNEDIDFTCDYALVNFTLKTDKQPGEVYINGDFTYDRFLPAYQMTYDETDKCYHATISLKQGYYSYQYLVVKEDGSTLPVNTEGNFYQTKNRYDVLVYFRGNGDRTDRLVGHATTPR